ncbi:MAG: hypothetical protein IJM14_07190 [Lachnospiraceae bacterium]|nr:hypothetical protein [Lachnospiraceae bacterium]
MKTVNIVEIPADFRYKKVYLKGKPVHDNFDSFTARHPRMDVGRRAKIFAPFDALRGFSAAILAEQGKAEQKEREKEKPHGGEPCGVYKD